MYNNIYFFYFITYGIVNLYTLKYFSNHLKYITLDRLQILSVLGKTKKYKNNFGNTRISLSKCCYDMKCVKNIVKIISKIYRAFK